MKALNIKYIFVIFILFLAQALFTFNSQNQIRYEELSESVRNIYYLEKGLVFSGINSTFGWYTPLRFIYHLFGFDFEYAKYFRLFLHVISLTFLLMLLERVLGFKKSLIPFIAIALSPTLLFFNTLRTHYGIDLQYLPIILFFLTKVSFKGGMPSFIPHILVWSLSMIAWSSYHTFIYYLPAIGVYYLYKLLKSKGKGKFKYLLVSAVSFFLPIILMVGQIENKQLLIFDPNSGGGLFRGPVTLDIGKGSIDRIYQTFLALLRTSDSYYYEVRQPDFSYLFPLFSIIISLYLSILMALENKSVRIFIILISLTAFVNILFQILFSDSGGVASMRRATALLSSLYAFYILGWIFIFKAKIKKGLQVLFISLLLLLPVHHLIIYPVNLDHLKDKSPYKEEIWLNSQISPDRALEKYVDAVQKEDLKLYIIYPTDVRFGYVYNWIYTAIASKCYFNKLECHKIYGFNISRGKFMELNLESVNYTLESNE